MNSSPPGCARPDGHGTDADGGSPSQAADDPVDPGPAAAGRIIGSVDVADAHGVRGWAHDLDAPDLPLALDVLRNGALVTGLIADARRWDLPSFNGGHCGFEFRWPETLDDGGRHVVLIRRRRDGATVPGAPAIIEAAPDPVAAQGAIASAVAAACADQGAAALDAVLAFVLGEVDDLRRLQGMTPVEAPLAPPDPEDHGPVGAGRIVGSVDVADARELAGWAHDLDAPDSPVVLDVVLDGTVAAQLVANRARWDLQSFAGGYCGFRLPWPVPLDPFRRHVVLLRGQDGATLPGAPAVIEAMPEGAAARAAIASAAAAACAQGQAAELDDMLAFTLGEVDALMRHEHDREREIRRTRFHVRPDVRRSPAEGA